MKSPLPGHPQKPGSFLQNTSHTAHTIQGHSTLAKPKRLWPADCSQVVNYKQSGQNASEKSIFNENIILKKKAE